MRRGIFVAALVLAAALLPAHAAPEFEGRGGVAPTGPLNTLRDVQQAIFDCWEWPPANEVQYGMELTIMLSFRRDGSIFGARINYQRRDVPAEEKALYYASLLNAMKLCSPLPLSPSLGEAIAGRPFIFTFKDTRKERKA